MNISLRSGRTLKTRFEAYSYRTTSRFGSRVRISVEGGTVSVTGPRIGVLPYRFWIALQVVLLLAGLAALVASVVLWDWRYLVGAVGLALVHLAGGGFGAGCLWEGANLAAFASGKAGQTVSFSVEEVERVRIGRGWARRGMWLVILPYVGGVNKISEGLCVSFEAPDGETGRDAVYALYMGSSDEAKTLASLLQNETQSSGDALK